MYFCCFFVKFIDLNTFNEIKSRKIHKRKIYKNVYCKIRSKQKYLHQVVGHLVIQIKCLKLKEMIVINMVGHLGWSSVLYHLYLLQATNVVRLTHLDVSINELNTFNEIKSRKILIKGKFTKMLIVR